MKLIEETVEILNTNSVTININRNNLSACSIYSLNNIVPNHITIKFASILENFKQLKEVEEKLIINTHSMRKSIQK